MGFHFDNNRLEEIRREEGWSITELAKMAGCSQPQMTRLLRGERYLSQGVIDNLLENADITADELSVGEWVAQGFQRLSDEEWLAREEERRKRKVRLRAEYRRRHPRPTLTEEEKWIRASLRPY
jgi:transcriptional regulator with XRE-family HTH domain